MTQPKTGMKVEITGTHRTEFGEQDVIITGTYCPAHPGSLDRYGAPESPDDPERIEDVTVTDMEGSALDVDDRVIPFYKQALLGKAKSCMEERRAAQYGWPPGI